MYLRGNDILFRTYLSCFAPSLILSQVRRRRRLVVRPDGVLTRRHSAVLSRNAPLERGIGEAGGKNVQANEHTEGVLLEDEPEIRLQ